MMIVWSDTARADILSIHRYIALQHPPGAAKVMRAIIAATEQLSLFPDLGRPSEEDGVRLLQVPGRPYLLPYRVLGATIEILAVLDERMERPGKWH